MQKAVVWRVKGVVGVGRFKLVHAYRVGVHADLPVEILFLLKHRFCNFVFHDSTFSTFVFFSYLSMDLTLF